MNVSQSDMESWGLRGNNLHLVSIHLIRDLLKDSASLNEVVIFLCHGPSVETSNLNSNILNVSVVLTGIQLKPHQLEAVQWLTKCFKNQQGCILGDEMGLGKTCQVGAISVYHNLLSFCAQHGCAWFKKPLSNSVLHRVNVNNIY